MPPGKKRENSVIPGEESVEGEHAEKKIAKVQCSPAQGGGKGTAKVEGE